MNSLPQFLELLAKSALVLTAAALLAACWPRASAAQRHTLWLAAFVALLLLPLSKLTTPHWRLPGSPNAPTIITTPAPMIADATTDTVAAIPAPAPVRAWRWPDATRLLTGLWLAGVAALLAYRLIGSVQIARLRRRSTPLEDTRVLGLARAAGAELDLAGRYDIRHATAARVPCTWGVRRPVILLPTAALRWNDTRLLAALRHEFGHIARRDYLTRWLGYIICALYWPNPLVWLSARSLHKTQEQACDDLVLRAGTPASDYAALLFETANASGQGVRHTVAMARPSTLEGRVLAIVDDTRNRRPAGRGTTVAGALVVVSALGISALAQVASDMPAPAINSAGTTSPSASTAPIVSSMRSPGVMYYTDPATIILPKLDFREATLTEGLDFLRKRGRELDPAGRGVNFVLIRKPDAPDTRITISLQEIPLSEALKYIAAIAEMEVVYEPHAVIFRAAAHTASGAAAFGPKPLTLQSSSGTVVTGQGTLRGISGQNISGTVIVDPKTVAAAPKASVTDLPIDIDAQEVRFENGVAVASGDVTFKHGSHTVTAEKLSYDPATKTVRTEGPSKTIIRDAEVPGLPGAGGPPSASVITKEYKVAPSLAASFESEMERRPLKEYLIQRGIPFGEGAAATYVKEGRRFIVRNTPENFSALEALVAAGTSPDLEAPKPALEAPRSPLEAKASAIVIPKFVLKETTLQQSIDALVEKSREADPEKKGIAITLAKNLTAPVANLGMNHPSHARITISLTNIPVLEALKYITSLAGTKFKMTESEVIVLPIQPEATTGLRP